ncbi:urea carboxylase-associated family protein [Mycolicibacterium flavescens]|uniref:Urea carboxylase-related aminomethyltransferase n=1 Tax=Mycolicibacterium flavescens TaxID=1776 RepID=A0A1E3RPM8_MYCFV|nr:urea carboxylase-associated family protein [Mycolicibacterium flavescens]MCV7283282.1 urea carboxylase-associated family protein [Mycolicibacterium flavescens]ODQ91801.1 Urea carboxylase-related aminomethyltransferase [Mycolicibacterium flavescens]
MDSEVRKRTIVAAGEGRAVHLRAGERVSVVDIEGGQVGDVFAFSADDLGEYVSAAHTRTSIGRLFPRIGEAFMTNRRRPMLTLVGDTSPGHHDMLIAACDAERYRSLGNPEHASCAENLHNALGLLGLSVDTVPQPVNVFMRIPVAPNGDLTWLPATSAPGDAVTFEVEIDCVFVVSACPMDLNAINGGRPTALGVNVSAPLSVEMEK